MCNLFKNISLVKSNLFLHTDARVTVIFKREGEREIRFSIGESHYSVCFMLVSELRRVALRDLVAGKGETSNARFSHVRGLCVAKDTYLFPRGIVLGRKYARCSLLSLFPLLPLYEIS